MEWFDCYKGEYSERRKEPGHNAVPLTCMTLAHHRVAVLHCTHSTKRYLNWYVLAIMHAAIVARTEVVFSGINASIAAHIVLSASPRSIGVLIVHAS